MNWIWLRKPRNGGKFLLSKTVYYAMLYQLITLRSSFSEKLKTILRKLPEFLKLKYLHSYLNEH